MEPVSWWGGSVSRSSPDRDTLSGLHRPSCSAGGRRDRILYTVEKDPPNKGYGSISGTWFCPILYKPHTLEIREFLLRLRLFHPIGHVYILWKIQLIWEILFLVINYQWKLSSYKQRAGERKSCSFDKTGYRECFLTNGLARFFRISSNHLDTDTAGVEVGYRISHLRDTCTSEWVREGKRFWEARVTYVRSLSEGPTLPLVQQTRGRWGHGRMPWQPLRKKTLLEPSCKYQTGSKA